MFDVRLWGNDDGQIPSGAVNIGAIVRLEKGMRAIFAPATPHSDSIERPRCSECGAATLLVGIEPERPGYNLHTFQCPECENFETAVGKAA